MSSYKHERGWLDSEVWGHAPYSEREAWSWIIGEAAFKDRTVPVGPLPVMIKRGQLTASLRFMASKWKWDKERVRRYLKKLEKWQMIVIETANETPNGTGQTILTVCNYNKYQKMKEKGETGNETLSETEARQRRDKLEEIQNLQEGNNTGPPDPAAAKAYFYTGKIIRLLAKDWNRLRDEHALTDDELERILDDRETFLASLPADDKRRVDWWMPTMNDLKTKAEGIRRSRQ